MPNHKRNDTTWILLTLLASVLILALPALADDPHADHAADPESTVEQKADEAKETAEGVAADAKEAVTDAALTTKVKSKFIASSEVSAFDIDVDTENGVVRLSGRVDELADSTEAERLAAETVGVVRVQNDLEVGVAAVADDLDTSDEQIADTSTGDEYAADPASDRMGDDDELPRTAGPLGLLLLTGLGGAAAASGLRRLRRR